MALVPPVVATALLAEMAGNSILGISAAQLAAAVSAGWCSYMLAAPVVTTADVGSLGAGVGNGVGLIVLPGSLSQSFRSTFTSYGINGNHRDLLINALTIGFCQSLLAAQILTAAAGTGVGAGKVVSVLPNPGVSIPTMVSAFAGSGLVGISSAALASAIAQGFDQVLPTAQGQVVIVGAGSPFPGSGFGIGKIL
jgi:hypothetical protein